MSDPLQELERYQREAWLADLDLREQAKTDPALAAMIADADAQYEEKYGHPWINPLAPDSV